MASLQHGMEVAGYRIDGVLGEGGMGTVYRATQMSLDRVIALKLLTAEFSSDDGFRERFRREGLLQAAIDHPHIVTVYEAGQTDQGLFLAMRLVEGPTLKSLIQGRALGDRRALRLLTQVAEALDAAHEKGLIHRDVKPQNILIGDRDHAYLADFGLTKAPDDAGMTATGQFVGTIDYVSPEQARGESATAASDVYALAGVLHETLTGQVPFPRTSEDRTLFAHLTEPPPRPSELRPDLPAALDEVIARGMAKDPDQRPSSASGLLLEARRALGVTPARADAEDAQSAGAAAAAATRPAAIATPGTTRMSTAAEGAPLVPAGVTRTAGAVPASAAAPTRAAARERRGLSPALLVAILAVAAAAVGALAGGGGSKGAAGSFGNSASAGNIELSFPAAWQRMAAPPRIPGLTFSQPLALAPAQSAAATGVSLTAGEVHTTGPTLLPGSFTAQLTRGSPHADPVRLGSLQAYRYSNLAVRGLAAPVTLYVVPTTSGVVTAACVTGAGSQPALADDCARIAATLRLTGTSAFPLTPSPQYAAALQRALTTLKSGAGAAQSRLAAAKTPNAQASAFDALSTAYASAATQVSKIAASPAVADINSRLAGALSETQHDYASLAAAVRSNNGGAYARASRALRLHAALATRTLAELKSAGYALSG
jgi:hypothetical protein